jgi:diacylglycerol O-acyltransferase
VTAADRLSPLDDAFLHLEVAGAHMHVAAVLVFAGDPPALDELLRATAGRLHRVPRLRRRLARVPLGQGRPEWVDDARFDLRHHVRHEALPAPGGDAELQRLAGDLLGRRLDRGRPLWGLTLVAGLAPGESGGARFALVLKTHHALVDGVAGIDLVSLLLGPDRGAAGSTGATATDGDAPERLDGAGRPWIARPEPAPAALLTRALADRARTAGRALRALGDLGARRDRPRRAAPAIARGVAGLGAMARAAFAAPPSPLNVPIGPRRRLTWIEADLDALDAARRALGGTLNDAVLAAVSLALGRWLRDRGHDTTGLVLRALVPVSVRAPAETGALGNHVAAIWAPLPVDERDPRAAFAAIHEAMTRLKASPQVDGAQALTRLVALAPPGLVGRAARLQFRQRLFNVAVTNLAGPRAPLELLGRRLEAIHPVLPLAGNQALGIAVVSYAGRLEFGLLADPDALSDLDAVAGALSGALAELRAAAAR